MPTEIIRIDRENPEASLVTYAAEQIRRGQVLGMPTDTFYGLAADPYNVHAVDRVYQIKSRAYSKPLSLLIASIDQAEELAHELGEEFYRLAEKFWPGPLTLIVKASPRLPLKVTANSGNVAIRIPAAKVPVEIIRKAGLPVTATSANLSGEHECTTAIGVHKQLGDRISIIVDGGESPRSIASTIVDLTCDGIGQPSWSILREGAIPSQEVVALLGGK